MLDEVIAVVRQVAREEIMPRFLRVERQIKADGSFFTEADMAAQVALLDALQKICPAAVMGEEMTQQEQEAQWLAGDAGLWSVDPIDGTSNFLNGLPYFAVSVAYMQHGRGVLGVIYNPFTDEMFYAEKDKGAYLNGKPLPINKYVPKMSGAMANIDLKRLTPELAAIVASRPPFASQRNYGACALEWCYVAAGYLDLYLHGGQKPWDYAAGSLVLREAGGHMCGFDQDDYWDGSPWVRSVIAANDHELFLQWRDWVRSSINSVM